MTKEPGTLDVVIVGVRPATVLPLRDLLATTGARVRPRVATVSEALAELAEPSGGRPHVVVVALAGTTPAAETTGVEQLLRSITDLPVLLVSPVDDEGAALDALRLGASGYLLTSVSGAELAVAVERAQRGEVVVDMGIGGRLAVLAAAAPGALLRTPDSWQLRPRERQVLERLVAGRSNREIALDLNLGEETVKTYLRNVYRKLDARDRSQAIAKALRLR